MKITNEQLKQIIKEELEAIISEQVDEDKLIDDLMTGKITPEQLNAKELEAMKNVDWNEIAQMYTGGPSGYQSLNSPARLIAKKLKIYNNFLTNLS